MIIRKIQSFLFDLFCIVSILGIWARFIEPKLLKTTRLKLRLLKTGKLKIVQLSDIHFQRGLSDRFLQKLLRKVSQENPDMIFLTGDFLCNGALDDPARFKSFLKQLKAPCGIFAVLGNHDYNKGIQINEAGDYDVCEENGSPVVKGLTRLFNPPKISKKITERVQHLFPHPNLLKILDETGISLLNNRTVQVAGINLTGVGEYMAGRCHVSEALKGYHAALPGIVLCHNPDAFPLLRNCAPDLTLSGHTHGGQLNLPWFWKRFTALEYPRYKAGVFKEEGKTLVVSRGVGGIFPFRFRAVPEIISISLEAL